MKPVKEFAGFFSGSLLALFIAAIAGHSQKPSDQMAKMRGLAGRRLAGPYDRHRRKNYDK